MSKTALAFMAHPDDAEFLCAGTLVRLREAGWSFHIATATPGDCGSMTEDRFSISATRVREPARSAAMVGGAYHCLDERDVFVVYDKQTLKKALDLFRTIAPALVFTHAARDYMMDHEMTSMLARAASFAYGAPNASTLPRRDDSVVPHLYYCDPIEGIDPLGVEVEPTTLVDVSAQMEQKSAMLACHASQRQWLRDHHGMDEYLEAMKRHAGWRGGRAGIAFAEAFVQHRGHAYPRNDLLAELFPLPK